MIDEASQQLLVRVAAGGRVAIPAHRPCFRPALLHQCLQLLFPIEVADAMRTTVGTFTVLLLAVSAIMAGECQIRPMVRQRRVAAWTVQRVHNRGK